MVNTRETLLASIILTASVFIHFPSAFAASDLAPDPIELELVSALFGIPTEKVESIYPSLVLHRDAIKREVSVLDQNDRLSWREFLRVRSHARAAYREIKPHLGMRSTQRLMRSVHSFLVPDSIRPSRPLGHLFESRLRSVRNEGGGVGSGNDWSSTRNAQMSAWYPDTQTASPPTPSNQCD